MIVKSPALRLYSSLRKVHLPDRGPGILVLLGLLFVTLFLGEASFARWRAHPDRQLTRLDFLRKFAGSFDRRALLGTPHLELDLKFQDQAKLEVWRLNALRGAASPAQDKRWLKGSIRLRGESVPVKIRLKVSDIRHIRGPKWSMRVSAKDERLLLGMRDFSLIDPHRRAVLLYWLMGRALDAEGLRVPRIRLVKVGVNGRDMGLYVMEEIVQEGLVFKFSPADTFPASQVVLLQVKALDRSPDLAPRAAAAKSLLEDLAAGRLRTGQVFDLDKLARWAAVSELFHARAGYKWTNMRFHFDPLRSQLEPVMWASFEENRLSGMPPAGEGEEAEMMRIFFQDPAFLEVYARHADRVARPAYLRTFLADIAEELEVYASGIRLDYPWYPFEKDIAQLHDHPRDRGL